MLALWGVVLGPCWGLLEPSWGHFEVCWGRLGVILWLSEAILGQEGLPLQKTKENLSFGHLPKAAMLEVYPVSPPHCPLEHPKSGRFA